MLHLYVSVDLLYSRCMDVSVYCTAACDVPESVVLQQLLLSHEYFVEIDFTYMPAIIGKAQERRKTKREDGR
jgi:hypothetical protein